MQVSQIEDIQDFLAVTAAFRARDLIRTSLITAVANAVAIGTRKYDAYYWWIVKDDDEIVGIAMRTVPMPYALSPMPDAAVKALVDKIMIVDPNIPGVGGHNSTVKMFCKYFDKHISHQERELLYRLDVLNPSIMPGIVRKAEDNDFAIICQWLKAFLNEVGVPNYNSDIMVRSAIEHGRYHILIVDGEPVAFGGHSGIVVVDGLKIDRIAPIYTPAKHRRHGYASAITSHISKLILDADAIPTLCTQAENPTSNKIYQDIGYEFVDENIRVSFD